MIPVGTPKPVRTPKPVGMHVPMGMAETASMMGTAQSKCYEMVNITQTSVKLNVIPFSADPLRFCLSSETAGDNMNTIGTASGRNLRALSSRWLSNCAASKCFYKTMSNS